MPGKLNPLAGQVIVVTGAGSGLGLEVARRAVSAGAAVVLAADDEGRRAGLATSSAKPAVGPIRWPVRPE